MSLTAYTLSGVAHDVSGELLPSARVTVQLVTTDLKPAADFFTSGEHMPLAVSVLADATTAAWSVDIPSNLDGNQDLRYRVTIRHPTEALRLVDELVQMPRVASTLSELVDAVAVTPTPETAAALERSYAEEWAIGPDPVSEAAGGDGTLKSAKGYAADTAADAAATADDRVQ
ncbi:MAG TPA: hypothetical protein VLA56_14995, partial [Pseudomonadales bacterium]|nr:hypothetical protein [Pseudomonadales bacterium]